MLNNYESVNLGIAFIFAFISFWIFCLKVFFNLTNLIKKNLQIIFFSLIAFFLILSLIFRGITLHRFPCSNLYESLLFFALGISLGNLLFYFKFRFYSLDWQISLSIITLLAYAIWLPSSQKDAIPLIPALDSYWRAIHVPALLFSYGFFIIAGFTGCLYLLKQNSLSLEIIYKCISFGFPLLTFGIVTGALWANHAWGNLWQWDPKENLALMTWFIYGAYLHLQISQKVSNKVLAWISVLGIFAIYMTYLGINHFDLGGLHSYGKV